MNQLKQNWFWN